jgi:hypothetical protein
MPSYGPLQLPALIGIVAILAAFAVAALVALFLKTELARTAASKKFNLTTRSSAPSPLSDQEAYPNKKVQEPVGNSTSFSPRLIPRSGDKSTPKAWAKLYARRTLTTAEGRFYDFLSETVKEQFIIQTKVPLRDLFRKYGWLEKGLYTMHSRGHIDFLLLEPITKQPVLAIELDYTSHDTPKGRDADKRKEELLKRANLPLRRIRVGKLWGLEEQRVIREALAEPLNLSRGS